MPFSTHINEYQKVREYALSFPSCMIKSTRFSHMVYLDNGRKLIASENAYGKAILGLITKVKREAARFPEVKLREQAPVFFAAKAAEINRTGEVFCYDKTAAYVTAAASLGIISGKTFDSIMRMPKRFRLSILGSLGTRKHVEVFEAGQQIDSYTERDEDLYSKWMLIVNTVSDEMLDAFIRSESIAFWTDALYSFQPLTLDDSFHLTTMQNATVHNDGKRLRIDHDGQMHLYMPTLASYGPNTQQL